MLKSTVLLTYLLITAVSQAQTVDSVVVVSTERKVHISKGDDKAEAKYPRTFYGLTFSRIDWGFSRLIDNGSFKMSEDNEFLDYRRGKATNFGFDILQFGLRMNDHSRIYLSTGFEWNYLRLEKNVVLDQHASPLAYEIKSRDVVNFKKNILTSTYLRIPLTYEWRSTKMANGDRIKIAVGPIAGVLLKGSQRLKSNELGKQSFRSDFNMAAFRYGGFVRAGFGSLGLFAKYYANDFFENSPQQEGINNLTFGLTLGL